MANGGQSVIAPMFPKPLCEVCERLLVTELLELGPRSFRRDLPALVLD
jgi:hypothetical protein